MLALDLGSKRIGVAVSDPDGVLASPVATIQRSGDRARDHRAVADLVAEWEADAVVVGLPLGLDGAEGVAARSCRAEAGELADALPVPVELHDERLTTVSAHRLLAEQGLDSRARRTVVDQAAAAVLLQSWLDARRPASGSPES